MAGRSRKKRSGKSPFWLMLLMVLLAIGAGFFYASLDKDKKEKPIKPATQEVHLDLKKKSEIAHQAINTILQGKKDWQVESGTAQEQSSNREDGKGKIFWTHQKHIATLPNNEEINSAVNSFTAKAKAENLFILDKTKGQYEGNEALILAIGIYDQAGNQEVSCVTDEIIFVQEKKKKATKKFSGTMTVIVDDCGYALEPVATMTALPIEMNFAVIPFKQNSSAALETILNSGKLAMLHLPMEPLNASAASENKMITVSMTREAAQNFTSRAIESLPGIAGVNNHQGSKATSNRSTMKAVLSVIKDKNLFFIDSNTIAKSIGDDVASEMGVATARNQRFLDNSSDVAEIKARILEAAEAATNSGSIIVICHARPSTAIAWSEIYEELVEGGLRFARADNIVQ
ncbi:MAG TPA: divergent polysaccharide deacetylase family protein [Candidatus Avacidaminococcus intestinavium]|uniref:Divergent polysaccharide deacetylase family protein n=1 Tax=Candidatus Avacidaminococcus intestinavium TaxID=2840684 RepID=A0A9D1MQB6_9FIRM|nr:divergent polysaccharide deacetylase family protein [Candidatus Avacidaminococcus intestinavium]